MTILLPTGFYPTELPLTLGPLRLRRTSLLVMLPLPRCFPLALTSPTLMSLPLLLLWQA